MPEQEHNPAHEPKVFSDEEIEMFLAGDRRQIDRLILYSLNRLAALHLPCSRRVETMMQVVDVELGGQKALKLRAEWVDAQIKKAQDEALFWQDMRKRMKTATFFGVLAILGIVALFYWNHHVPTSMQIDPNTIPRVGVK